MEACQVDGCTRAVSKAGHQFCLTHWKAERAGSVARCDGCGRWHEGNHCLQSGRSSTANDASVDADPGEALLSSTKIGKHFGLSNIKTNLILAELGWIEKYVKGWIPTDRGIRLGANVKDGSKAPFVVWPASILKHPALLKSIDELHDLLPLASREGPGEASSERRASTDFRTKFRGDYCTQDGHFVKSRAEAMIDNWLYQQQIAHAYERRLPIEEDCYCDFYIAAGKGVYLEYWGRESDPKYRDRMATKKAIYAKHGLRLIELGVVEIERLDDVLPRMLL